MNDGCRLCPRQCGFKRSPHAGFCGASDQLEVSSVCIHRGEEPPLNPIVNVFFSHCNLHCIYCQNHTISAATVAPTLIHYRSIDALADQICSLFSTLHSSLTTPLLGLVTPTHYAHLIPTLLETVSVKLSSLPSPLPTPTVVYNSGGYETVETLRHLEGLIDIYLPDFKYIDSSLANRYSHAPDYPEVATAALQEMIRQVGTGLKIGDDNIAYRGLIVRHLVLPGHIDNSLAVLDHLSTLITHHSSPSSLHLSLMAQYYPPRPDLPAPLNRTLTAEEYATVADRFNALGFNGWLQELQSQNNYRPDFSKTDTPFT